MANPHNAVYKLTPEQRQTYKDEMRAILIQLARDKKLITYGELALRMSIYLHPHSFTFTNLLRQVCGEEYDKGHGMLCALVVSKITGMPSGGYFRGMANLREDAGMSEMDIEAAWRADVESVFALWDEK